MLTNLLELLEDTVKIVSAPVSIAVDVTRVITKPMADIGEELAESINELTKTD